MKICPQCGWENDDDFGFCLGCGHQLSASKSNLPSALKASELPLSSPPSTSSPNETTDCPKCGQSVPINNQFCGGCGSKILNPIEIPQTSVMPPIPSATSSDVGQPSTPSSFARLILLLPNGQEGGTYPLKPDQTLIGRKQGNILFLDDPYVFPLHATFFRGPNGELRVRDENSLNGLFLRLRDRIHLQHKDIILLGKQLLCFEELEPPKELPPREFNVANPDPTPIWGSPHSSYWGRLVQVISGGLQGNSVLLGGPQVDLGRERGQLTFPGDRFISGLHARVSHENDTFFAEDLGSRNGTFLRIREELILQHSDILIIGEQLLRVEINS